MSEPVGIRIGRSRSDVDSRTTESARAVGRKWEGPGEKEREPAGRAVPLFQEVLKKGGGGRRDENGHLGQTKRESMRGGQRGL